MQRLHVFSLFILACLSGCARHATMVETGNRDQVLHYGNKDEPSDMDPHINTANSTSKILMALFEGLVTMSNDGRTVLPGVAERWEISPDGLTYTFHLRAGATWSNGAPITARDFVDSFLRLIDPQLGCEQAGYAFPVHGARDFLEGRSKDPATVAYRAPDPRTVVIVLDHPAPYFLGLLTTYSFDPVYMPSLDANGGRHQRGGPWTLPGVLVSNGPFVLSEWKPNAYVSVKRNPNYWGASRVRLAEVRFYPTDNESAEERAFRAGQLHVTTSLPKTKIEAYDAEHASEFHVIEALRTNYLTFNVHKAPFTDARVRRAFALAIDREQLVHAALGKLGAPAHSFVRPGTAGYTPPEVFSFAPDEARRLMSEAGYPGGAGFPTVEFTLNGNTGVTVSVAEVIQQMWTHNLGVEVTLRPLEFKVYLSTEREKQFEVVMEGWSSGIVDPRDLMELAVSNDPNNDAGASLPDFDAAFAAADATADPKRRAADFDLMERINAREVVYAPLYYSNTGFLVHPSVRGWRDNAIDTIDWRELYLAP